MRKYATALEKAGYVIARNDGKNRDFSTTDVMAFQYLQSLRSRTGITLESAAEATVAKYNADTAKDVNIVHSENEAFPNRDELRSMLAYERLEMRQLVAATFAEVVRDDRDAFIEDYVGDHYEADYGRRLRNDR